MACCCCDNPSDNDSRGEEGECCVTTNGRACICLPYNDGYMITAQLISIAAFCISWVWWPTFVIGAIAMILLQVFWCCRQDRAGLIASAIVCAISAILCFFSGLWTSLVFKNTYYCVPFVWYKDDDFFNIDDDWTECHYRAWSALSFLDCALWLTTSGLVLGFVWSGRYESWEHKLKSNKNAVSSEVPEDPLPIATIPDDDGTGNVKRSDVAIPIAAVTIEDDPVEIDDSNAAQSSV